MASDDLLGLAQVRLLEPGDRLAPGQFEYRLQVRVVVSLVEDQRSQAQVYQLQCHILQGGPIEFVVLLRGKVLVEVEGYEKARALVGVLCGDPVHLVDQRRHGVAGLFYLIRHPERVEDDVLDVSQVVADEVQGGVREPA